MNKNKEKGFALILSIVLLIVMSLMGGSLIVVSSGDHQSNNNSDQYQQTFYVAETGLMEGEKWILDNYLGHWMTSIPSDNDVLGEMPSEPGPLAAYNVRKEIWDDKKTEYDGAKENNYFRHTFGRGPAINDTVVNRDDSVCLMSFKNLDFNNDNEIKIVGRGNLPIQKSFLNIVTKSINPSKPMSTLACCHSTSSLSVVHNRLSSTPSHDSTWPNGCSSSYTTSTELSSSSPYTS